MYDNVYRADILTDAYDWVRLNKGAPRIDGVTFKAIVGGEEKVAFLAGLQTELRAERCRL